MRFWGIEKHRTDGDGRFASQVDPLRGFMKGRKDFDQKEEGLNKNVQLVTAEVFVDLGSVSR